MLSEAADDMDSYAADEEVTFLLRLRPTPSPPVPRRKPSYAGIGVGGGGGGSRPGSGVGPGAGWDVYIERRGSSPAYYQQQPLQQLPPASNGWGSSPALGGAAPGSGWDLTVEQPAPGPPPGVFYRPQPQRPQPPWERRASSPAAPGYFYQQQALPAAEVPSASCWERRASSPAPGCYFQTQQAMPVPTAPPPTEVLGAGASCWGGPRPAAPSSAEEYRPATVRAPTPPPSSQSRPPKPPPKLRDAVRRMSAPSPRASPRPPGEGEERIRKLEADKESLQLQVSVLTEQIEAQGDKIADLEKTLDEKRKQLDNSENLLQREMLTRSSLETQKLELMSTISDLKLQMAALERENIDLRERLSEERRRNKPPLAPRAAAHATSTPIGSPAANMQQILVGASPSPSPVSSMSDGSPRRIGSQSNSGEDYKDLPPPRTPPANYRRKVDHYGSLPRQRSLGATIGSSGGTSGSATAPVPLSLSSVTMDGVAARKGVAFGKGLGLSSLLHFQQARRRVGGDKSFSTPNLADAERVVIEDSHVEEEEEEEDVGSSLSPQQSPLQATRNKGIKKIFGRMKRSGSGNLEDLPIPSLMTDGEFRRGGVRATAGPRLGWNSQPPPPPLPDGPFAQWDSDSVARWLTEMGLECYAIEAKRWVKSGAQLLAASQQEIEKELGMKNPLHRKKLLLALASVSESPAARADPLLAAAGQLDSAWVLRWLDDAGLPQHKEVFLAARVDGRVLHRLAEQDLALLHVTSSLHVASLRRGIQVLRDHNFEPDCLKRRSLPDESSQPTPQEVALWTNHRVMEWLRAVDLAEYAPNLRGSGVHGGLMVHEPRFTAELLASLLSIPPSKTLLRRHLNTHFKELLGRDCIQEKREAEATLGYVPLSATTKVKLAKKSQFTLKRKKSKSELDFGDLVCPMDSAKQGEASHGDGAMKMNAQQKAGVVSQVTDAQGTVLIQPSRDSPQGDRTSNV
ncbi:liprin-beta-1 isoform X12 [Schistocerca gregaria]|uniref:liprin-beta-1 isoform X12 n=1 Tax=Schistocerca gregaria TaxID=7010 RepID=UPI00211E399D|nr:liprin-beta-1 isoform X12 [Schistocerca gregaria]